MRYEHYTRVNSPLELVIDRLLTTTPLLNFIKDYAAPIIVKKEDSSGVYFHDTVLAFVYVNSL